MRITTIGTLAAVLVTAGLAMNLLAGDSTLTPAVIENLRSEFPSNAQVRAIRNALTNADAKTLVQNRDILATHNDNFSHKVNTKGITNQMNSGRCWMFASFNVIKPVVLQKLNADEFTFSEIYLQFWDKLEKSNAFLEYMIEFRDCHIQDRSVVALLKTPATDGGYWCNFADLVNKYGIIPKEAMAETASSGNTRAMNSVLDRALRRHAVRLRRIYRETGSVEKMREAKEEMLNDVYRILALNLGEPPTEFTWRYRIKDNKKEAEKTSDEEKDGDESEQEKPEYDVQQNWSELRTFTPKAFYEEFVGLDLDEYVNIYDDPIRPKYEHVEIEFTGNIYGSPNLRCVNASLQEIKEIAIKVLLDNQVVCFAADVTPDQDKDKGIMARGLYDYESLYDIDLGMSKVERALYRQSVVSHSMAFIGVDLKGGKPMKWLVENSWGSNLGNSGLWTMYDDWFDDNVYSIIVHRDYVPGELLKVLDKPVKKVPVWDPMW